MTTWNCKDPKTTFNRRSDELKASAIRDGMTITAESDKDGFHTFQAHQAQHKIQQGLANMCECGANSNVGGNPYIWWTVPLGGQVYADYFCPKAQNEPTPSRRQSRA